MSNDLAAHRLSKRGQGRKCPKECSEECFWLPDLERPKKHLWASGCPKALLRALFWALRARQSKALLEALSRALSAQASSAIVKMAGRTVILTNKAHLQIYFTSPYMIPHICPFVLLVEFLSGKRKAHKHKSFWPVTPR